MKNPLTGINKSDYSPLDRLAAAVVVAIVALLLLVAAFASFRNTLLHFLPDDCFYYLEISRRIWMGQGSTFDGINRTNGYHPLWLVCLIPVAPIMNASREAGARVVMVLCILLLGTALFLLRSISAGYSVSNRWVALLLPAVVLLPAAFYGMESALAALVLTALLVVIARAEKSFTFGNMAVLGLLSGALILARLDSALYVFTLDLILAFQVARASCPRVSLQHLLLGVVLQSAIVAPYLAFNLIEFKHLLPISAVFKAARAQAPNLYWARSLMALVSIGGTLVGLGVTWLEPRVRDSLVWLVAMYGSVLTLALAAATGGRESYSWTFTLPVICSGLFFAGLADVAKKRGSPTTLVNSVAFVGCLVLLAVSIAGRLGEPQFASRFDRAKWIGANAPANAVFAAGNSGGLGYFSEHSFINVDGLTNSFAFGEAVRDGREAEWLKAAGLNFATIVKAHSGQVMATPIKTKLTLRGSVSRTVCLTLEPLTPNVSSDQFELLRVVNVEKCP
ncbi:MAG TPA: hypothetical protein VN643_01025 [Pyrinomonadaceae bacterium]|nr:hypothetical protein [Pyrinomonadaceae bacterium]